MALPGGPGEAGDAAGARDHFKGLLPILERLFGPGVPKPWPPAPIWPTGHGDLAPRPETEYRR